MSYVETLKLGSKITKKGKILEGKKTSQIPDEHRVSFNKHSSKLDGLAMLNRSSNDTTGGAIGSSVIKRPLNCYTEAL